MAKNRKDNIDSFSGMFQGTSMAREQIKGQENIETLEGGKYMPAPAEKPKEKKITAEPKKRGRPKANREIKERKTFTLLQSDYEQASKIAYVEGKSVSEIIGEYLAEYVEKNKDKLEEYETLMNEQD